MALLENAVNQLCTTCVQTQCNTMEYLRYAENASHISCDFFFWVYNNNNKNTYSFLSLGIFWNASNLISPNGLPRSSRVIKFFGRSSVFIVLIRFPDKNLGKYLEVIFTLRWMHYIAAVEWRNIRKISIVLCGYLQFL